MAGDSDFGAWKFANMHLLQCGYGLVTSLKRFDTKLCSMHFYLQSTTAHRD